MNSLRLTRSRLIPLTFGLAVLLVAASGLAQTGATYSSLIGTTTTEGKALPGVTVTISSPALQGTRTTVSGEGGGYNFPALPPGVYTVNMTLEGMQPVTRRVELALGQPSRVDGEMKVGAMTEAITVTASAPAVLETTQIGTNFKQEQINNLPIARNIRQTVLLTPGVNPNGVNNQITISGAPTYENTFMVNGVVVNENLRGQPHDLFIEDAIQETTVLTAGISAEYGRFTGGVVSTLTKSGGNDFTGSLRDTVTNPSWSATPDFTNPDTGVHAAAPPDKTNQVYEATFGGRLIRDRLWFFGAGRKAKTSSSTFTFGTNLPITQGIDEKRYEGKLTAQIGSRNNVVGSYLKVNHTDINNIFGDIYDLASIVPSRQTPNKLTSVAYSGIWTNSFLTEIQWAKKEFAFIGSGGRFRDPIRGTWIGDFVTGARFNAPVFCGVCTPEARNSDQIGGKATYFLSTRSMGNHNLVFGADRFTETRIVNNNQSASDFTLSARAVVVGTTLYPRFDGTTQLTWWPILALSNGTDLKSDSLYVNDRWDFNNHFSFNAGGRYDKNHAKDSDGTIVSNDSNFSPRLGVNYDVRGDGKHRVTVTVARYVAKITDGSNVTSTAQAAGSPGQFTYAYKGPVINPAGTPADKLIPTDQALQTLFDWFNSIGGTKSTDFIASSYPGFASRFPSSLKSPAADEFTLGYGMQLGRNAYAKIDGVHRQWHNFYAAQITDPTQQIKAPNGVTGDYLLTVNDDKFTKRRYNAIELQGQWQATTAFYAGGNYTWSTLKGNDVPEGSGTATIRNRPGEIYYPEYFNYAQRRPMGYLAQDRRHRARAWAGYTLGTPIGRFNISAIESFDSGFAYSAIGTIDATGRNSNFKYSGAAKNPGYSLGQAGTLHDYYFSSRGAFRTNSRYATDLSINYALPIIGKYEMFFRGDLLNAFNTNKIVDPSLINTDVITSRTGGAVVYNADGTTVKTLNSGLSPFNPFTATPVQCPKGAPATQCASMHANYQLGPHFGEASSASALQVTDRSLAPRTYRFSAGFRF